MGLSDWLSKEARDNRAYEKTGKRALNRNAQHEDRMGAIEALAAYANEGRKDALDFVLRRFELTTDKAPEDNKEKQFARDVLEAFGADAVDPIRRHIAVSEAVVWPVQVLARVADQATVVEAVLEVLEAEFNKDSFKPNKKLRLLEQLGGLVDERIEPVVERGLVDFDESVRFQSIETLLELGDERALEPLLKALTDPQEESERIRLRILRGLQEREWPVTGFRKQVEEMLPEGHHVDKGGRIRAVRSAGV